MSAEPRFTPGDWVATRAARGGLYENSGVDLYEVGTEYVRVAENCTKDDALLMAQSKELLKIATDAIPLLRREYVQLAEKYAGTRFEQDPSYAAVEGRYRKAVEVVKAATGECT